MTRHTRNEFTQATKDAALKRSGGCCEGQLPDGSLCRLPLQRGRITYDHIIPDFISNDNSLENCQVLGWCCDKIKTPRDQADIAKVKRVIRKDNGIRPKSKFAGAKDSKFKIKIGGGVVDRQTGERIR